MMKTLRLFGFTWLGGFISIYPALAIKLGLGERFSEFFHFTEFLALAFTTLGIVGVCFGIVYLPGFVLLRRVLHGVSPTWLFPVTAIVLGLMVTIFVALFAPHHPEAPSITPDLMVICWMLAVSGLVAGCGFVRLHGPENAAEHPNRPQVLNENSGNR